MSVRPVTHERVFLPATVDNVLTKLIEAFNGAKLSDGGTLTATDRITDLNSIPDSQLPFMTFSAGSWTNEDFSGWECKHTHTIPAVAKVRVNWADKGQRQVRRFIEDCNRILALVRGLPIDESGKVTPYTPKTAYRFDDGSLVELVDRVGPRIVSGNVVLAPGFAYAAVNLQFQCVFLSDYAPNTYKPAKVTVIGLAIGDAAETNQPEGRIPATQIPAADVFAGTAFNSPVPRIYGADKGPIAFQSPPFPPGDDGDVLRAPGDGGAQLVRAITVAPQVLALGVAGTGQLAAISTMQDFATWNVTAAATWASASPLVATVSATGLVTGVAPGTASITCTFLGITSSACTVTVS